MSIKSGTGAKTAGKKGMGFIPENRKEDGILPNLGVKKNLTLADLSQFKKAFWINRIAEDVRVKEMIKKLNIKTPSMEQLIVNLSGGNQQKVIVSRWLIKEDLKILIIDEPTRGIDVGAKSEIYSILNQLAKNGLAVIMMSSEMPELLSMCDRVYVMKKGRIKLELSRVDFSQEKLLEAAL